MSRPRVSLAERFWSKVDKAGECWLWIGWKDADGYGQISLGGRSGRRVGAHVAAWLLAHGQLPALQVLHRCDNPACVRAEHLFLGTQRDNMQDMVRKGRKAVRAGEENPQAKLTEEQIEEVRSSYVPGVVTQRQLSRQYGVSQSTISEIVNHKAWKNQPGGKASFLHSDDFGVEVTVAVVRWPLVAAVISKEEPDFGGAVVTQEAGGLRCADCGESLADFDALQVHRLNRHP
jgi:hypothetical protein